MGASGRARWLGGVVGCVVVLAAATADAQSANGERDRREARAVKSTAFSLLVPVYQNTTISQSGFTAEDRTTTNRLGIVGSLVSPIGDSFGWRALLGGGWSKFELDQTGSLPSYDDEVGDFVVGGSVFRRSPSFGAGGLSYLYRGRSTDFTNGNRRNRLGVFGQLYNGDFDFGVDFGYAFGKVEGETFVSGGIAQPPTDRSFDGFVLDADARWYAARSLSATLGLALEVQNHKFESGGATAGNVETTAIGPTTSVTWLPGFGEKRWLALEGSFAYQRLKGSVATGGIPVDGSQNQFRAGAVIRVHLPRVESLKELLREY